MHAYEETQHCFQSLLTAHSSPQEEMRHLLQSYNALLNSGFAPTSEDILGAPPRYGDEVQAPCSPLATHQSTTLHPSLTTYHSPLVRDYLLLTTYYLLLTTHYLLHELTYHYSLISVHYPPLTTRHSPLHLHPPPRSSVSQADQS